MPAPPLSQEQADRLSTLFDTHVDRLYRLARRLVARPDDALDLVQETFLKSARSLSSVPRESKQEEAWLVRVLVNIRRDQWRRESVRKRHESDLVPPAVHHDNVESTFVIRTIVWKALDHLSPRRRAIVVMREIEGLSIAAIASLLGITAITVRWHLSRARRELARRLEHQLGGTNAHADESVAGHRSSPSRSSAS